MDLRIPPLKLKIMLESNPLKSRILVLKMAVYLAGVTEMLIKPMSCSKTDAVEQTDNVLYALDLDVLTHELMFDTPNLPTKIIPTKIR